MTLQNNGQQTRAEYLGTFYRIRFFGDAFEKMNGMQFIYKEEKLLRIVDVTTRLKVSVLFHWLGLIW